MSRLAFGRLLALAAFVTLSSAGAAAADVPSTVELTGAQATLARLFQAPSANPEWFTPAFLEQVPIDKINAVLSSVRQQFGTFRSVDGSGLDYEVHLERGSVHVRLVSDHSGLIAGLLIQP